MIKPSTFLRNVITTSITSFLTIIALIFIIRFLARGLGAEEFGAYSLARRVISNIAPLILLAMDIALVRYVAMSTKTRQHGAFIVSALVSAGAAMFSLLIIGILASKQLSFLIFNSSDYLNLYYALLFFLGGYAIFMIVYSFYRGRQKFHVSNLLQLSLMAIFPLLISYFFASQRNSTLIIYLMGIVFYLSIIPLVLTLRKTKVPALTDVRSSLKIMMRYGLPRAPAGFAFAGLLTLGPFLANLFGNMKEAGYFVVSQSVFRILESAIVGFGLVALPKVSQIVSENRVEYLKSKIEDILIMIFHVGLFISIHIFIWSKEIVLVWLGSEYRDVIPIMKIIILSLGPYLGYVILRSIVDAVEVRAVNTINLFLSLGFAVILSLILVSAGLGAIGLAIGTTFGFTVLGILTGRFLVRRFQTTYKHSLFQWVLILNVLCAAAVFVLKRYALSFLSSTHSLFIGFIIEGVLFLFYMTFLYRKKCRWVLELKERIFQQPATHE
jgi:O-antigen/teichoic acid export membrane protein